MRKFKCLLYVVLPLLLSGQAMADQHFNPDGLNKNAGYVYNLLHLVFGDFINAYGGGSLNNAGVAYSVLSTLGYWACIAGMILAVLLISSSLLNAYKWAGDPEKHIGMDITTWIKFAIVMILISPVGMHGISLSQRVGVLKTSLMGDAFANQVYASTIEKMLVPPSLDNGSINASNLASNIMKAEACAWAVQNNSNNTNIDLKSIYKDGTITPVMAQDYVISLKNGDNREIGRYKTMSIPTNDLTNVQSILFSPAYVTGNTGIAATTDACGSIVFPEAENGTSVFANISQKQTDELKKATVELANALAPAAQALYGLSHDKIKMSTNGSQQAQEVSSSIVTIYNNAVNNYIYAVQAIPGTIQTDILGSDGLVKFILNSGWGLGVVWWKLMSNLQSSFSQTTSNFSHSASAKVMTPCVDDGIYSLFGQKYCVSRTDYNTLMANISYVTELNAANVANNPSTERTDPEAKFSQMCNKSGCSWAGVDSWLGDLMKGILVNATGSKMYNEALSSSSLTQITEAKNQQSIFDVASKLGISLSHYSMSLFGFSAATDMVSGALAGGSKTIVGFLGFAVATGSLSVLLSWVSGHLNTLAYLTMVPAKTLLVVIPFIPIMIWGVLLLSYFIMIIEAYIAVPSGMAMWVVKDEIFLSGRVIRTVMMITALFLRPFLFVVGLVASYALAPIAMNIWNTLFFWGSTFIQTGSFMTALFLVFVYTAGLIKFTMLCYNVSFVLPDKVLQWLGSGFGDVASFGSPADFGDSMKMNLPKGGGGGGGHFQRLGGSIKSSPGAGTESGSDSSSGLSSPPSFQQATGAKALEGRVYEGDFTRIER